MLSCSDIPDQFICPITSQVMRIPYVMPDGHTYERDAIKQALESKAESPITRQPMRFEDGRINYSLLNMINQFRQNLYNQAVGQNFYDQQVQQNICNQPVQQNICNQPVQQNCDGPNKLHLFVKNTDGKMLVLNMLESDTLLAFKNELNKLNGIDTNEQWLTYQGKPLANDNLTLKEYGFQNNGIVHLNLRVLGGIFNK